MSYLQRLKFLLLAWFGLGQFVLQPETLWAGSYLNSAHGTDVSRPAMSGYAPGSCGHCHEMHASLEGEEPAPPLAGGPSLYTLFAGNFDTLAVHNYEVADNFCFYCHGILPPVQAVINTDYSETFGGASGGVQSIMAAFNQVSYHNLGDIHGFVYDNKDTLAPWYTYSSNPCNACHNPHLAKKNNAVPISLVSAISKPSDHFNLWGEGETMLTYSNDHVGAYEAPYSSAPAVGAGREPDNSSTSDGSNTPDYVGFCTTCHNSGAGSYPVPSATLGTVRAIDWSENGDKHGGLARGAEVFLRAPFSEVQGSNSDFLLSCLNCHEPHGSSSVMLIRQRVNGEDLEADVSSTDAMSALCRRCHGDDLELNAGTVTINKWQYAHHLSPDAPYPGPPTSCGDCHAGGGGGGGGDQPPIDCIKCHFHGSDDSWMDTARPSLTTGRKTF